MDSPEGETVVEKVLHKEAVRAILNGAAVFFPDKHVRRDKLFHMMVSLKKKKNNDNNNKLIKIMTICNITVQLFAEEYYRRGSTRVSEGDVWVTLQLLQVSIRYAKTYGVHIQITVDQQQLCSLHTVTRIQAAFSCSHPKERPQTLTSAPYCQSWKHCCWWQQERWDHCHTFNVSADLSSCYVTLLNSPPHHHVLI